MKIVDPHLHLFDLAKGNYHWLKPENPPHWPDKAKIQQNFGLDQLQLAPPLNLAGFVHIEAGFDNDRPWREIEWLTAHHNSVSNSTKPNFKPSLKTVAFIDICADDKNFNAQLEKLLSYDAVVGCRYILDQQASNILQQAQVLKNLTKLAEHQLSFDLQMPLTELSGVNEVLRLLALLPSLKIAVNHAGFAPLTYQNDEPKKTANMHEAIAWQNWQQAIALLSRFENCQIKCSGWEMISRDYAWHQVGKTLAVCLKHFGEHRVMLASNFPLTLLGRNGQISQSYQNYWHQLINCCQAQIAKDSQISAAEQTELLTNICANNAINHYKIS